MRRILNYLRMRVRVKRFICVILFIGGSFASVQVVGQTPLPKEHDFECYDVLIETNAPEYNGLGRLDYGVATSEMKFSPEFDVSGQSVVLYTTESGTKLYEATPIVRFENHSGRNLKAIWKSLRRGDIENGFPAFARSQVGYSWPGRAIVKKTGSGATQYSFNAAEIEVHISYDVKLPQWNWNKTPSKRQLSKWKKYSCDVALHEKLHINPTRQYIMEFVDEIPNLSAKSLNDLRYQLNLLWQKTQKSIGDENIRIDTVTNHGQRRLEE